jgi:hypothetical protein
MQTIGFSRVMGDMENICNSRRKLPNAISPADNGFAAGKRGTFCQKLRDN